MIHATACAAVFVRAIEECVLWAQYKGWQEDLFLQFILQRIRFFEKVKMHKVSCKG